MSTQDYIFAANKKLTPVFMFCPIGRNLDTSYASL